MLVCVGEIYISSLSNNIYKVVCVWPTCVELINIRNKSKKNVYHFSSKVFTKLTENEAELELLLNV